MEIRELRLSDYKQFIELCSVFRETKVTEEEFKNIYYVRRMRDCKTFVGIVVDEIVATHTVLCETKFINSGGKVAHFEDLIVHPDYRKHGIGESMLENSIKYAKDEKCYKAIYSCSKKMIKYYERILKGYPVEVAMRSYFG